MAGGILEISDASFEQEVLKSSTPVLVDFWAEWCGPCKALAPTIEKLSLEFNGKVKFCKVNVDDNPNTAARFGVRAIPTLILFQSGQPQNQLVGNVGKNSIEELFKKLVV